MARKPRLHVAGMLYHILLQSVDAAELFADDIDRQHLTELLKDGLKRFGHRIYAYCYANSQIYLAVEIGVTPVSYIVHNIAFRYSRWFNRRHQRSGPLFRKRFCATLVDKTAYLLPLVCHIHRAPVRLGSASAPEDYQWSSHASYLGTRHADLISTSEVLSRYAQDIATARERYRRYVEAGKDQDTCLTCKRLFEGGGVLGDKEFLRSVLSEGGIHRARLPAALTLPQLVDRVCDVLHVVPSSLVQPGKDRQASAARKWVTAIYRESGGTLAEAAKYFRRDISTLSRQTRTLSSALWQNQALGPRDQNR